MGANDHWNLLPFDFQILPWVLLQKFLVGFMLFEIVCILHPLCLMRLIGVWFVFCSVSD
jgi:hypothetical protein